MAVADSQEAGRVPDAPGMHREVDAAKRLPRIIAILCGASLLASTTAILAQFSPHGYLSGEDSWSPMRAALTLLNGPDGDRLYETIFFGPAHQAAISPNKPSPAGSAGLVRRRVSASPQRTEHRPDAGQCGLHGPVGEYAAVEPPRAARVAPACRRCGGGIVSSGVLPGDARVATGPDPDLARSLLYGGLPFHRL